MAEIIELCDSSNHKLRKINNQMLVEMLSEHKKWVDSEGKEGAQADFSYADLSGADLSGTDLQEAIFKCANLTHANLQRANLKWTDFSYADLSNANVSEANYYMPTLYRANLDNVVCNNTKFTFNGICKTPIYIINQIKADSDLLDWSVFCCDKPVNASLANSGKRNKRKKERNWFPRTF